MMAEIDVSRTRAGAPVIERTGFRLSWGAILAGVVVATALQVVLTVLGLAIGFGAYDQGDALGGFGKGAAVWLIISALVTLFVGGLTTGRLAGVLTRGDGMLHGIVLWGVSALFAVWMVASGAGAVLGGAFNILGRTVAATAGGVVGAAGQVAGAAVNQTDNLSFSEIQREVMSILDQTGAPALQPDSLEQALADVRDPATSGQVSNQALASEIADMASRRAGQVDRQAVTNVIAARTDLSQAEAEQLAMRVENALSSAQNRIASTIDTVTESAGEVAASATDTLSTAAWWSLLALALSAGAAAMGAAVTAKQ